MTVQVLSLPVVVGVTVEVGEDLVSTMCLGSSASTGTSTATWETGV